jgi:hypothetical protein
VEDEVGECVGAEGSGGRSEVRGSFVPVIDRNIGG